MRLLGLVGLLCSGLLAFSCAFLDSAFAPARATHEAQVDLTYLHGDEVWAAIHNFESRWGTAEILENPDLPGELATQPLLPADWREHEPPYWGKVGYPDIAGIEVLEYTPEQFRVLACLNNPSPGGLYSPSLILMQYVFVKQDGIWKVAAGLNMDDRDDVRRVMIHDNYGPDWMRTYFRGWTGYIPNECIDIHQPTD